MLQGRHFWDIPIKANASYGWRKMLQIRSDVRRFFFHIVGKGDHTSAWFDTWHVAGPLDTIISRRDIYRGGFHPKSVVKDLLHNNIWAWPNEWSLKYENLSAFVPIQLNDREDRLCWKHVDGSIKEFSVSNVWNSIRPRSVTIDWFDVVWFSNCIPRHAFLVWLLIGERLKTQDKLKSWEMPTSVNLQDMRCPLCKRVQDNHSHLFFECNFSEQVWHKVTTLMLVPNVGNSWSSFVMAIKDIAHKRVARVVVAKLLFGATVYFIWQERNNRLFKKRSRQVDQVFDIIFSTTRLKLMSIKFKESAYVARLKMEWNLDRNN